MVPAPHYPYYPQSPPSTLSLAVTLVLLAVGFGSFFLAYFGPGYAWLGRKRLARARRRGGGHDAIESAWVELKRGLVPLLVFLGCMLVTMAHIAIDWHLYDKRVEAYNETYDQMENQVCDALLSPHGLEIAPNDYCIVPGYDGHSVATDVLFPDGSVVECELFTRDGMVGLECPVELPQ